MALDIHQAVRKACLWLPEAEEVLSHGSPSFRVRGKGFAHYVVNHHGDGRVALWLNVLPGAQQLHVAAQPKHFFVPPYVGPSGWLGVLLDRGLSWNKIAGLVREAYEKVAPADLRRQLPKTPLMQTPTKALAQSDIDPFKSRRALTVWKQVGKIAAALPDTREGTQFGSPSWLVGKKTFLIARHQQGKLTLCFWWGSINRDSSSPMRASRFRPTWATTAGSRSMSVSTTTPRRSRRWRGKVTGTSLVRDC